MKLRKLMSFDLNERLIKLEEKNAKFKGSKSSK